MGPVMRLIAALALASAAPVTIDNTKPRLTSTGIILDGHDGRVQKFPGDDRFWLHTLSYGLCMEPANRGCDQTPDKCGFRLDHNISIYTSPDLSSGSWEFQGYALDWTARPPGTVFRPDVVFNPNTGKFVLWYNEVAPNGTYLGFIAATADAPQGPFTIVGAVPLSHSNATYNAGDFKLFVDDDGTGYVIYGAEFWMWIEKLNPDYLSSSMTEWTGPVGGIYFVEAPALIKRNGKYLALFDHCCCFCMQGSGIRVYEADSPLGPWTAQGGDVACVNSNGEEGDGAAAAAAAAAAAVSAPASYIDAALGGIPTPGQGCLYNNSNQVSVTRSQQSGIAVVNTTEGETFLWFGDRWQQSPDGVKGHDPQFWVPLVFDANGVVQEVKWVDNFTINLI